MQWEGGGSAFALTELMLGHYAERAGARGRLATVGRGSGPQSIALWLHRRPDLA
jgi:hypothetical protein